MNIFQVKKNICILLSLVNPSNHYRLLFIVLFILVVIFFRFKNYSPLCQMCIKLGLIFIMKFTLRPQLISNLVLCYAIKQTGI